MYLLTKKVAAGEQLTKDAFTSCTVKIKNGSVIPPVFDSSAITGLYAKTALKKGSLLTPDLFFKDAALAQQNRYLEISDIRFPEHIQADDFIDVRISFPNGEDYTVLKKQRILSLLTDGTKDAVSVSGISLCLSEEDLLRLSSARVDKNLFEGTYLYAVIYRTDFEKAAETTYPVNPDVFSLMQWNPNIVSLFTVEKEQEKRALLEEHLQLFIQKETGSSVEIPSAEELPAGENNISQM